MSHAELHQLVVRIRGEFIEMPGLTLTLPQASRLFGLEAATCRDVIGALVDAEVLRIGADERIVLAHGGLAAA